MELSCDWVAYHEMFRRPLCGGSAGASSGAEKSSAEKSKALPENSVNIPGMARPISLVVDAGIVIEALADDEDLSTWIGAPLEEVRTQGRNREIRVFSRAEIDASLERIIGTPAFHLQVGQLKRDARAEGVRRDSGVDRIPFDARPHFLVEALKSGWNRVLPSSYALFIRVEGGGASAAANSVDEQEFILVVRRGELAGFHRPDLSFLGNDRRRQPSHVVKYLSEKYLLPVQGLFVPASEWNAWMESESPWKALAKAIRANQARLVPFRWSVMVIAATRAFVNF